MKYSFTIIFSFIFLIVLNSENALGQNSAFYTSDFESSVLWDQGWSLAGQGEFSQTSDKAFSGFESALIEFEDEAGLLDFQFFVNPDAIQRNFDILNTWVLIPENISTLDSISLYADLTLNGEENGIRVIKSYSPEELQTNTWNKLSIDIPSHDSLKFFGLLISTKTGIDKPDYYVDLFTSSPNYIGVASFGTVQNLETDSIGTTYAAFSWEAPSGEAPERYLIMRHDNYKGNFNPIDTTSNLFYYDSELLSSTAYFYGVFALDSLNRRAPLYESLLLNTPAFDTIKTWDFENGAENWKTESAALIQNNTEKAFSNRNSVKVNSDIESSELSFFKDDSELSMLIPGQTIFFHFFIDEISLNLIDEISAYSERNDQSIINQKIFNATSIIPNAWNEISVKIPEDLPIDSLSKIGIQIQKKEPINAISFFVDLITTDPYEEGDVTISPPSNLKATVGYYDATLNWSPSVGTGKIEYYVTASRPDFGIFPAEVATTDTTYTINGLEPGIGYKFSVVAIDETEKYTESIYLTDTTQSFETSLHYDFEKGSEGWFDPITGSEALVVDSISYSGVNSVKLVTEGDQDFSFIALDNPSISPGQIVKFYFFLPSDTSNIRLISIATTYNEANYLFEETYVKDLTPGDWNKIEYTVPDIEDIQGLAFNYFSKTKGTPPIYIDFITTEYNEQFKISPHLTIPGNLSIEQNNPNYTLTWDASSGEDELTRYYIYQKNMESGEGFKRIASSETTSYSGSVPNNGVYQFKVTAYSIFKGRETDSFVLEEIFLGGLSTEDISESPKTFELYNNYPNPFNPATEIRYDIPEASEVTLQVFDVTGRLVQTLVNEFKNAGTYTETFKADNFASGVYFYRIEAGSFTKVQSMLLIK